MTLADILIPLAGSISNEKALKMREACNALEAKLDIAQRGSNYALDLISLLTDRVKDLERDNLDRRLTKLESAVDVLDRQRVETLKLRVNGLEQLVVSAREGAFCEAADAIGGLYSTKPQGLAERVEALAERVEALERANGGYVLAKPEDVDARVAQAARAGLAEMMSALRVLVREEIAASAKNTGEGRAEGARSDDVAGPSTQPKLTIGDLSTQCGACGHPASYHSELGHMCGWGGTSPTCSCRRAVREILRIETVTPKVGPDADNRYAHEFIRGEIRACEKRLDDYGRERGDVAGPGSASGRTPEPNATSPASPSPDEVEALARKIGDRLYGDGSSVTKDHHAWKAAEVAVAYYTPSPQGSTASAERSVRVDVVHANDGTPLMAAAHVAQPLTGGEGVPAWVPSVEEIQQFIDDGREGDLRALIASRAPAQPSVEEMAERLLNAQLKHYGLSPRAWAQVGEEERAYWLALARAALAPTNTPAASGGRDGVE